MKCIITIFLTVVCLFMTSALQAGQCQIIPQPQSVEFKKGEMTLSSRIVISSTELKNLAVVVAEEFQLLTGKKLSIATGKAAAGDISLNIDPKMKGESYEMSVDQQATIKGGNYDAVAMGTVSLLQSLVSKGNHIVLPKQTIKDKPAAEYRGLLVDIARRWHKFETLKQLVVLCRWYKIRYLQLHFNDTESFTFPSKAFPNLATKGRHYTLDQMKELEAFAVARGVTIIPEVEMPGHSAAIIRGIPEHVACDPPYKHEVCPGRESTYQALDTIIGEFCQVFKKTPYFHIGADEVRKVGWAKCKHCQALKEKEKLEKDSELYRRFIVKMNEVVKKHGKKTIVWEGFHREGKIEIPRDITVMVFECLYNLPQHLIEDGYTVINASWQPLYVVNKRAWEPESIYNWNMYRWENFWPKSKASNGGIDVEKTSQVIGAQMCAWEQKDEVEIPSLRKRLPTLSQRIWNPDSKKDFKEFSKRLEIQNRGFEKLLQN
ncbi:MAG: family 20 glycosylhydrolase [Akkermansiaceae bacterium]